MKERITGLKVVVGRAKEASLISKGPYIEQAVDWMIELIEEQQLRIEQLEKGMIDAKTN